MFIYIAGLIYYKWLFLAIIKTVRKENSILCTSFFQGKEVKKLYF